MERIYSNIQIINETSVFLGQSGTKHTADDADLDLTPDEEEGFFGFLKLECEKDVECDGSKANDEDIDISVLFERFNGDAYVPDEFVFDTTAHVT